MPNAIPLATRRDPTASARSAGLNYTTDARPGIQRVGSGSGFRYIDPSGKLVRDAATLARIRSLVIPPAWTRVWICPDERGHIQATGRDARGRKQYRYHRRWREVRDETKYYRLIAFARALPAIRRRTHRDLGRPGLSREKVLAAVVQLLEKTLIRVGNDEYARQNHSFGLTTMRDGHVKVNGRCVRFAFRGKSGVEHEVDLEDLRLAKVVKACRDIPGYDLFQYLRRGRRAAVDRVGRRERVSAGGERSRPDVEGLPHLGRHGAGGPDPARLRTSRLGVRTQEKHRPSRRVSREAAGEYARRLPEVLYPSGSLRCLSRRRGSARPPPTARAGRRTSLAGCRAEKPPCSRCSSGGVPGKAGGGARRASPPGGRRADG